MTVPACDRPLATTSQFRAAVRQVLNVRGGGYTDKPRSKRPSYAPAGNCSIDDGLRYVLCYTTHARQSDIDAIEVILWAQGVTAKTRSCSLGVRGNCIITKPYKTKVQNHA